MSGEDSEVAYFAYFGHFIVFVCVFLELISKFSGSLNYSYILIKHDQYGSCCFVFSNVAPLQNHNNGQFFRDVLDSSWAKHKFKS